MAPVNLTRLTAGRAARQGFSPPSIRLRQFHQSSLLRLPYKDSQHKDSINTEATEYSKSRSDDETAANTDAAFNPKKTDPEEQKSTAAVGNEQETGNPLEVSPANPDLSKQRDTQEGGAENAPPGKKQSGHGSPAKGKKVGS